MVDAKVSEFVSQATESFFLPQIIAIVSTSTLELKSSTDSVGPEKVTGINFERLKRKEPPFFKNTSKENQFNACKSILEVVEDSATTLVRTDKSEVKAKESLDSKLCFSQSPFFLIASSGYEFLFAVIDVKVTGRLRRFIQF